MHLILQCSSCRARGRAPAWRSRLSKWHACAASMPAPARPAFPGRRCRCFLSSHALPPHLCAADSPALIFRARQPRHRLAAPPSAAAVPQRTPARVLCAANGAPRATRGRRQPAARAQARVPPHLLGRNAASWVCVFTGAHLYGCVIKTGPKASQHVRSWLLAWLGSHVRQPRVPRAAAPHALARGGCCMADRSVSVPLLQLAPTARS